MPRPRNVSPKLAHALADPVRIGVLTVLRDGPMSEATVAARLRTDARTVARHGRELTELGFIRSSGEPRTYELVEPIDFPDEIWAGLSTPVKRAATAATLAQIEATTEAAVADGGFDRTDMHLTRTSLVLDREAWASVSQDMLAFRGRLHRAHEEAAQRLGTAPGTHAHAVLMLFAAADDGAVSRELPPEGEAPEFGSDEGRLRAFELYEALGELMPQAGDWDGMIRLVDELRVVLRAAAQADARQGARPAERPKVS